MGKYVERIKGDFGLFKDHGQMLTESAQHSLHGSQSTE